MRVAAAICTWSVVGFLAVFAMGGAANAEILKVEPDIYPEFTVLTIAYPGVTLIDNSGNEGIVISRDGFESFVFEGTEGEKDNIATTGTLVFSRDVIFGDDPFRANLWGDPDVPSPLGVFRADFDYPVISVGLDLICTDDDDAFLRAYDAAGTLLAEDPDPPTANPDSTCDGLGRDGPDGVALPVFFPATVTSPPADIAYVLAAAQFGDGVYLDNLQVNFTTFVPVVIDIKPGKDPNLINLCDEGDLKVAILSSETFDAVTEVKLETVLFAGAEVKRDKKDRPVTQKKDVNKDRIKDLIVKFEIPDILVVGDLMPGDTLATLLGEALDGRQMEGIGAVEVEAVMCLRTLE